MLVVFETESGRIVTDEIYVRTQVGYEVRTEVVGGGVGHDRPGPAPPGQDLRRPMGRADRPGFVERFGAAYDTELQHWVDAARTGTIDGPGAWDGYAAVAVCEAGVEALRTKVKVAMSLDPQPSKEPQRGIRAPGLEAARP